MAARRSENGASRVLLGLGGARGYAPGDLTSPARAAAATSLVDTAVGPQPPHSPWNVTELRIHGVSGSDGPTMLEHPHALQVAGSGPTAFYRRWAPTGGDPPRPGVPWRLEAYSWGGLTEAPLASAAWILLAPFMLFNVAHFALPPAVHRRQTPVRAAAHVLLRLLALAATLQFTLALVAVFVDSLAMQSPDGHPPSWLRWYTGWGTAGRLAVALILLVGSLGVVWLISVRTASSYEARVTHAPTEADGDWPLTQPGFWRGQVLVARQRSLHGAAALALVALALARPGRDADAFRWTVVALSGALLLAAASLLATRITDRYDFVQNPRDPSARSSATLACRALAVTGLVLVAVAGLSGGWRTGPLPGLEAVALTLLAVQVALLLVLLHVVAELVVVARRGRSDGADGSDGSDG